MPSSPSGASGAGCRLVRRALKNGLRPGIWYTHFVRTPLSVMIVAAFILLWALFETYLILGAWRFLVPVSLGGYATISAGDQAKMGYFEAVIIPSAAIKLMCGIFILKGANWARILWAVWFVAYWIADEVFKQGILNWEWIVILCALTVVLFLPKANAFFMRNHADS